MSRILVTGGAGFVGSHLCEQLIDDGHDVICLDNLFTGTKKNIEHLMDDSAFEFIRHDVTDPIHLEVDQIYHLACPASPVHYKRNPVKTILSNVQGTLNMLSLARDTQARILLSSTSEVYGDPLEHPQKETYWGNVNPVGVRSCYDEGKRCAEALMTDYAKQWGVEVRIARIFNTFGPRMAMDDGRVVSNFIVAALRNEPLLVYGDGKQTRSFMYVPDLIKGLIKLMASCYLQPVNLGNPVEFTIEELAQMVLELTGSNSKIEFVENGKDDPKRRLPDIALAHQVLSWWPTCRVIDGLWDTIGYFKKCL